VTTPEWLSSGRRSEQLPNEGIARGGIVAVTSVAPPETIDLATTSEQVEIVE
jgi:hypothetical protein